MHPKQVLVPSAHSIRSKPALSIGAFLSPSPHDTTVHAFTAHPQLPTAPGSVFPPLPPQAKQIVNWLVELDKNWLSPGLPLLILYGGFEIGDDRLGFWFFLVLPLLMLHAWILKLPERLP